MLGHSTLRKPLHFRGHKGTIKKAYVHRASKGSNPLDILFQFILKLYNYISLLCESFLHVKVGLVSAYQLGVSF
jgi:hypothetical protein